MIVSSDKDMMQLVTDRVTMLDPAKDDLIYDAAKVKEFLGVTPAQVADLFALKGDAIDNIPGAPGIGDKGARDLIEHFGSVEAAMERAAEVERKMYRESLQNNVERIRMSKRLATIDTAVPIPFALEDVAAQELDLDALKAVYKELEFHSLLRELGPSEDTRARDYQALNSAAEVEAFLAAIPAGAPVAVALAAPRRRRTGAGRIRTGVAAGRSARRALLAGRGAAAVPRRCRPRRRSSAMSRRRCWRCGDMGIEARGFAHDVMLYAFLLDADPSGCPLEEQARRRLDIKLGDAPEQRADLTLEIWSHLHPAVEERGLRKLYETIDLPLTGVLARMERTGILHRSRRSCSRLSALMEGEIARLTAEIHELAGKPFNISSPQQLGKVLFEDLGLPAPVKYGKGKVISTAADVLEELAPKHEIVRKVLEYRQLTKLKGTYVDALPSLIDPRDGPPAHQLQPGRRGHRAAVLVESEPAEHSDQDGAGPRDPRGVRAARRAGR